MGARGPGHIARLCEVARPQVGVVTEIGVAHTEMFGTIDEVIAAKGELVQALPSGGTAVLKAGADYARQMAEMTEADVLTFGIDAGDVRATAVVLDDELRPSFVLDTPWGRAAVRLEARGLHNVANAAAAAAAAVVLGSGAACRGGRSWKERCCRRTGWTCWSLPAVPAFSTTPTTPTPCRWRRHSGHWPRCPRSVAPRFSGLMAELGDRHDSEHRAMADLAGDLGIRVIAVG